MPYKNTWGEKARERSKRRNDYFVKYRKKNLIKEKARRITSSLIKRGFIKKENCYFLDKKCHGRIECHHKDYSNPLDILWLCSFHHREKHNKLKEKLLEAVLKCHHCGVKIRPPKNKYCSNYCNLAGWRNQHQIAG